jgi:hypothetical protein
MVKVVKKRTGRKGISKKKGGILDQIKPIQELEDTGIKMNIYGRSGTGKTTLASTFEKPMLFLSLDNVLSAGAKSIKNVKGIDYLRVTNIEDLKEVIIELKSSRWKTVCLDTVTGLQDMVLKCILGIDELPAQSSWGMATQQNWGQCGLQVKEIIRSLLNEPINVILLAQERDFNTDSENDLIMPFVASALTPSITGWLNGACDYIVQTHIRPKMIERITKIGGKKRTKKVETDEVEYCLRTGPHAVYTTKFRVPKGTIIPNVIVDPSYQKLKKLVQ